MDVHIVIRKADGTDVHEPVELPLTIAMSYGPPMIRAALEAGHTVTLSPA